jgi:phage terminase Nu1 subunit (DNA packaging protein)
MKILNGWKEIAAHLNQGVRTVQRWEVIGLPIHRVRGRASSPVIAFAEELNDWAEHAPVRYADLLSACNTEVRRLNRDVKYLKREIQRLKAQQRKPSH